MIWWYAGPIIIGIIAISILVVCTMFGSDETAMLGIVVCIVLFGLTIVTLADIHSIHSDIETEIYSDSEYNTAEMAALIDGVISEAKDLGSETIPDDEFERMMDQYEKHHAGR